jgi:hypothetical protein
MHLAYGLLLAPEPPVGNKTKVDAGDAQKAEHRLEQVEVWCYLG